MKFFNGRMQIQWRDAPTAFSGEQNSSAAALNGGIHVCCQIHLPVFISFPRQLFRVWFWYMVRMSRGARCAHAARLHVYWAILFLSSRGVCRWTRAAFNCVNVCVCVCEGRHGSACASCQSVWVFACVPHITSINTYSRIICSVGRCVHWTWLSRTSQRESR